MTRLFAALAVLLLTACASLQESDDMPTGAEVPPPLGCEDLRKREGDDAC